MKNPNVLLSLALLGSLGLGFGSNPVAARSYSYDSIELIAANADVIVRGTIAQVGPEVRERDSSTHEQAVVHVVEVLKGPKVAEVTVALPLANAKFAAWRDKKTELLLCLRDSPETGPACPFVLICSFRQGPIELDRNSAGVVTMDFQVLTARKDILAAARGGVAAAPSGGEKSRVRLTPPSSTEVMKTRFNGYDPFVVFVPIDSRLEARGKRWAQSESWEYRCLAPLALGPFKSEQNVALVTVLLKDGFSRGSTDKNGGKTRYFPVRWPAYLVLKKWGVAVEKPDIEVPVRDGLRVDSEIKN